MAPREGGHYEVPERKLHILTIENRKSHIFWGWGWACSPWAIPEIQHRFMLILMHSIIENSFVLNASFLCQKEKRSFINRQYKKSRITGTIEFSKSFIKQLKKKKKTSALEAVGLNCLRMLTDYASVNICTCEGRFFFSKGRVECLFSVKTFG